ncbi:unnamed protein product [Arctogadus glacialis]
MYRWSGPGAPLRGSTGQRQSAEGQLYHIFVPIYWGRGLRSDFSAAPSIARCHRRDIVALVWHSVSR